MSNKQTTKRGVPQGSILGPLLFLLFINDLPMYMQKTVSGVDMYADDTTIFDINVSKEIIERNLQSALNNLNKWCINNGMFLNASKTKVLLVTTPQKHARLENKNILLKYKDVNLQLTIGDS